MNKSQKNWNPLDHKTLAAQIRSQETHRWNIETDINWAIPIDLKKPLLPLDDEAIVFPGANEAQRLALSQLLGLMVNATIGEMEDAIFKLRDIGWEYWLRTRPVNPEMWKLGDLFFEEEAKHSATFARYVEAFCEKQKIARDDLDYLLPKVFGSRLLQSARANCLKGGALFWWIVAITEEASIEVYRHLRPFEEELEPLFYSIHRRHLEEEARHRNYAFLMLDLIYEKNHSLSQWLRKKTDLLRAQALISTWVVGQLSKVFEVKRLAHKHPFFETLASCLPLFEKVSKKDLPKRLLVSAPFISLILNPRHHRMTLQSAKGLGALSFPYPKPQLSFKEERTKIEKATR